MKKILLLLLLVTNYCFSQTSGITYQAVVYNPNGEQLPGVDNPYAPLTNQNICLQFGIIDNTGSTEYQEQVQVTTDNFGMVNLLIGTSSQTGGYSIGFNGIEWSAATKFLKVDIDIQGSCSNFEELSNQPFTYVPFAYYSPASDIPGPAGEDGLKSLINTTDEPAGVNCANGGSRIEVGVDSNNNNILDLDEIDDSLTRFVCDVQDGVDGEDGLKSLINTIDEPAGVNCDNGGFKIEVGIDTNNNNILDPDEIDDSLTRFVCDVQDGEVGLKSLINTIDEPAGINCANGGSRIEIGIDSNNNNILDLDEIDDSLTRFVCDLQDGEAGLKSLINTTEEPVGPNCDNGGFKIEVGIDTNNNNILDLNEIDDSQTRYVCDGILPNGTSNGNTTYWNGNKWVTDDNHLYNDGENIMIGTEQVEESAALTLESNAKGFLLPRMTLAQRNAINNPATSLLIFQLDDIPGFYYFDGTQWINLSNSSSSGDGSSNGTGIGNQSKTLIYTVNGF